MSEARADYCTPIPNGFVCGTRSKEHSRESIGIKWCFACRKKVEFNRIVMVPDGMSYYGPYAEVKCSECECVDGDLFPGRYREWEEE